MDAGTLGGNPIEIRNRKIEVLFKVKDVLLNLLSESKSFDYPKFREYCNLKSKGLRNKSFQSLEDFLSEVTLWDELKSKDFICWLFSVIEVSEYEHHVLVHQLIEGFVKPFLKSWMDSSNDPRPYRWYGLFLNSEMRQQ